MYSSIRPCVENLKWKLEPPAQHRSENNKRSRLESRKTAIGWDLVEQNCRYAVEFISTVLVEARTHDNSALVSGFHIYFDQSGIICEKSVTLNTEEGLYQPMPVLSSLNNQSDAEYRSCDRMTAAKDPNVKCNLEAAGRSLKLFAHLYWTSKYSQMGRRIRVFRAQEGGSVKYVSDSEYENRGFMSAYRDIFQVLHLWQNNITHRGIGVGNLMDANEKVVCGVLCDWYLATVDNVSSKSLYRIGTRAFLAIDLLGTAPGPSYLERFDWESALYILIWITTRYEDEKEKHTGALTQWLNHKDTIAFNAKYVYINVFRDRPELKTFKLLHRYWIHPWTILFRDGFRARDALRPWETTPASESFENETLGGHVTYEKIRAFLKQDLVEDDS